MRISDWHHRRRVMLAADRFALSAEEGLELQHIIERAERLTGRLTMIAPVPMDPRGPSGRVDRMVIDGEALDLVQVPEDADEAHQEHIALHELAHLVLGHVDVPGCGPAASGLPLLSAGRRHGILAGSHGAKRSLPRGCVACDPAQEREAEAFAHRLAGRIAFARRSHAADEAGREARQLADRVDRAFGIA